MAAEHRQLIAQPRAIAAPPVRGGKVIVNIVIVSARPAWAVAFVSHWSRDGIHVAHVQPHDLDVENCGCDILVVDCAGLPSAERLVREAALRRHQTRIVALVTIPCDLVADRLRVAGVRAVVSEFDGLEAWEQSFHSSAGFYLSPVFSSAPRLLPLLTARQRDVYEAVARGLTDEEIGSALKIATITAETHRRDVQQKLGCHTHSDLVLHAVQHGVVAAQEVCRRSAAVRQTSRRHCLAGA